MHSEETDDEIRDGMLTEEGKKLIGETGSPETARTRQRPPRTTTITGKEYTISEPLHLSVDRQLLIPFGSEKKAHAALDLHMARNPERYENLSVQVVYDPYSAGYVVYEAEAVPKGVEAERWRLLSDFDRRRHEEYMRLRGEAVEAVRRFALFGKEKLDKGEELGVFGFDSELEKEVQSYINALTPVYAYLVGYDIDMAGVMACSILDDVNAHTESRALREQFGFRPSLVKTGPLTKDPGLWIAE